MWLPHPTPSPTWVQTLKGAVVFMSDLVRAMDPPPEGMQLHYIRASSYGSSSTSSGEVALTCSTLAGSGVAGRHVLLVRACLLLLCPLPPLLRCRCCCRCAALLLLPLPSPSASGATPATAVVVLLLLKPPHTHVCPVSFIPPALQHMPVPPTPPLAAMISWPLSTKP